MNRTKSGMGFMTVGLWMIAIGTIGPVAIILASAFLTMGGPATAKLAYLLMVASSYAGLVFVVLALLGQLLCLVSPLEVTSKIPLAVVLVSLLAHHFVVSTSILLLMAMAGFIGFLYGVSNDLESPELKDKIGSSVKFFAGAAFLNYFLPSLGKFLGKGTLVVALVLLALAVVGLVKYTRALVELARKANVLRSLTD